MPVWLEDDDFDLSYNRFCKQILWPTFHYTSPTSKGLDNEHEAFRAYWEVNRRFADAIEDVYQEGDIVWINDYHLLLVPQMVRERLPHATIGLFVHIAFPSSEIFRCLSMRETLLKGMLGADLIGFQTHKLLPPLPADRQPDPATRGDSKRRAARRQPGRRGTLPDRHRRAKPQRQTTGS